MLGIEFIESYIPNNFISNSKAVDDFNVEPDFIQSKIGIDKLSRIDVGEDTSQLALKSIKKLLANSGTDKSEIDCLILITQNPDNNIPHTSAIIHGELKLNDNCACFDISLGCSGYVYGLSVIISFMESNGLNKGILVTSDPYSKIINQNDKNTSMLFGDASSATLISSKVNLKVGKFNFGTYGKSFESLILRNNQLEMKGRNIFNFVAKKVPEDINSLLRKNELKIEDVDIFIFHQASKYLIDTLIKRMNLDKNKVPFDIKSYGNTVSSSIPIVLKKFINAKAIEKIIISGFGVGLSWSSTVLTKK